MKSKIKILLLTGSTITLGASPAFAQEREDQSSGKLQEIIVTAQKLAENLQGVPDAATALERQGIDRPAKLELVRPDLAKPSARR